MSELYKLPDGWEWKTLGESFIVKDGTHDSPKYIKEGGYPLFTSKNLKDNGIDTDNFKRINKEDYQKINKRSKVDKGDLLFAMIGTIGSPTIVNFEPNFAIKNVALFKPKSVDITIKLLKYYFNSNTVKNKMINEAKGATQKFVGLTYLRAFPFPIIPLPEQQRIVSKLDLLFEKIDRSIALHQKNMDEVDLFMGSVLNDVFGELEEKYDSDLIKNILDIAQYGFSTKSSENGKYPFLRMGDLQNGKVLLNNLKYVNLSDDDFLKYKLEKHDLLFNRTNSYALVGKTSIYESDIDMSFASYLVRLRVNNEKILPYFLNYYLNAENTQNTLKAMATKAINQSNINAQKLKSISTPVPPLNIQQKVVIYLDEISEKIEKIKSVQKEKMASLKALKASILDQAFRGEL